jgi:hypothetical protein
MTESVAPTKRALKTGGQNRAKGAAYRLLLLAKILGTGFRSAGDLAPGDQFDATPADARSPSFSGCTMTPSKGVAAI